ncbi:hypothetical protein KUTeg_012882 [Tegillarca granosa]|uniref:Equilibrative nucleoside transporter 3 n=1 Tax=Tegillarca granosa TaxID=220873 RepID=A0ABQ9EXL1_TEGGR|nr:hypothetical protein KUTeg_012882 [Tegillarca granosa]
MEEEPLINSGVQHSPPKDRFNFVYIVFYILGLGSLLPWNFFITAKEYYQFKLRNTSYPDEHFKDPTIQTELQTVFEGTVAVASMVPNLLFNFITAAITKRMSLKTRMAVPVAIILLVFSCTVALTQVDTDNWQEQFYVITIISVMIMNACSSMFTASLFGLAGMFPVKYFQATMSGQAVGGIFAALANILSLTGSEHIIESGFWFFIAASITCIVTLLGCISLHYINFSTFYLHTQFQVEVSSSQLNDDTHAQSGTISKPHHEFIVILKKMWVQGLSVCLVFYVTLCCFPAVASAIGSVSNHKDEWTEKYFSVVVCFLLFNVGDWAGRSLAGMIKFPRASHSTSLMVSSYLSEKAGAIMSVCLTVGLALGSLTSLLLVKVV